MDCFKMYITTYVRNKRNKELMNHAFHSYKANSPTTSLRNHPVFLAFLLFCFL